MKNFYPRTLILSALAVSVSAFAGESVPEKTGKTPAASLVDDESLKALSREEIHGLMRLAELPREKLAALRQSVERLEKMTPEERSELRQKLEKLRHAGRREIDEANRQRRTNFLVRYWNSLPPEKKEAEAAAFKKMTPEERRAYVMGLRAKLRPGRPGQPPPPPESPPATETDK